MQKSCSPKAFKWLSAPARKVLQGKLVLSELSVLEIATLLSPNHWQILSKIPAMHYCGLLKQILLFWSVFECQVPLFNKLIQLLLPYRKFANLSKPRCWVKLETSRQSKPRCWGKLGTLHQSKPRLWCSNFWYREFPQEFTQTIGTFWVFFGLSAAHSSSFVSASYKHSVM